MADVKVESIKYHTTAGKEYPVGATYSVDESAVENLQHLGMAVRVDRAEVAKQQASAAEKTAKARAAGKTAVTPMTTNSARALAKPPKAARVRAKK